MKPFTLTINIAPRGKERPRARIARSRAGKQWVSVYTPAETRKYEEAIALQARQAMRGVEVFDGAITVLIDAVFVPPTSWSNAKWSRAVTGIIRPTGKPDYDNIAKAITDACNKIVFKDDSQIVDCRVRKLYGKTPCIIMMVRHTEPLLFEQEDEAA